MTNVDETFDAIVAEAEGKPVKVTVGGEEFTLVKTPAAGALLMMSRRMDDKDWTKQMAAAVRLLEQWIVPEEHERLWSVIENLESTDKFNNEDLPLVIQAASHRPT